MWVTPEVYLKEIMNEHCSIFILNNLFKVAVFLYVCHEIHLVLLSRFFGTFFGQEAEGPPTICRYSPGP